MKSSGRERDVLGGAKVTPDIHHERREILCADVLRYLEPAAPAQYGAVALGPELWLPFAATSEERITITDPLPGVYVLAVVAFAELQTVEVITALE